MKKIEKPVENSYWFAIRIEYVPAVNCRIKGYKVALSMCAKCDSCKKATKNYIYCSAVRPKAGAGVSEVFDTC